MGNAATYHDVHIGRATGNAAIEDFKFLIHTKTYKSMFHRHRANDNFKGRSLLGNAATAKFYLRRLMGNAATTIST